MPLETTSSMSKTIEQLQAENKKLKQSLTDLQNKFSVLSSFERNAKEIFWQMDFSLQTTYISQRIKNFLGYTPKEFMEKDFKQLITTETYQKISDIQQQFVKEEKLIDKHSTPKYFLLNLEYVDIQDKIKPAKAKFSLYYDGKNNPVGIQGYIFYEETAQLLSREQEQLKSLFDSIFSQSVEGAFLFLLPYSLPWADKINKDKQLERILSQLKPVGFNKVILEQFKMTSEEFSQFRITNLPNWKALSKFWQNLFDQGQTQVKQLMKNRKGAPLAIEGEFVTLYNDQQEVLGVFGIQHDITDSFLIEETTGHELNLKKLWDKANIAIFVVQNEKIVFWNKAAFNIIEPTIEKNKEYKFSEIVYEEDLPLVYERYKKRIQGEDVESTYSFRVKTPKGEIRWLQIHSAFYLWNGQAATLNFARDITDEIRLKEQLETTKHRFEILSKNSSDIIAIYNGFNLVYLSENTERLLGYTPEFKTPFELVQYIHPDDRERVQKEMETIVKKQQKHATLIYRVRHASGVYLWWEVYIDLNFENGELKENIAVARDITERKELEEEIREKEKLYRLLAENTSDGVSLYEYGKQVYQSSAHSRTAGYKIKIPTINDIYKYMHPDDIEPVKKIVSESIKNRKNEMILNYRIKHKNGNYIWIEAVANAEWDNHPLPKRMVVKTRDITSRKKLENEIREKEKLYRLLAENTSDGVALYEYGKMVYQSPGRAKMLGRKPDIETMEDAFKYIHPEDLPKVNEAMTMVLKEQLPSLTLQYRVKHNDGHYIWIEILANIEYDKAGNPFHVIFKTRDISSRINLEEKIRQNEAQYRLLAENSTDGIALFENGELIYMSPSYTNILGDYLDINRIEEMFDYIHPDDLPKIKEQVKKIRTEKIERDVSQYRIRKKDGSYVWFEDIIHSEFDDNGNQVRVILNSRDVTKRIETQNELKETEKQLKMLLTNMSDFLFLIDKDSIIKYTTPYTLSYFGYDETKVLGKSFFEFIYPPDLERLIQNFTQAVNEKSIGPKAYRVVRKDSSFFWMEITGNSIENNHLEFVIVGRDITERIEIQEQLKKQHTELTELNATKDKFFSILAHDLRSPFNQIMGFSDLLSKNIHQYDIEKIAHFVGIIRNSSVKAYQLLENLLNWSMAKRGIMEFYPVTLNIIPLVKEETNRLSEQIKTKNIDVILQDSSDILIPADENMFRIIIRNIFNNAIKFTPINGKINIEFEEKNNEIAIAIKDNGIGMEQSQIHTLFELSENRSTEGTQGEKGTGLGLLVVKDFADKHKAKIEVNSKKDKGTEVKIIFPKSNSVILS